LLEDDGLGLDFAYLFRDDLSSHLLQDQKPLLDDIDAERLANDLSLGLSLGYLLGNEDLRADDTREVVDTVEVVEARETGDTTPVVERLVATGQGRGIESSRCSKDITGQGGNGEHSESEFGEHGQVKVIRKRYVGGVV